MIIDDLWKRLNHLVNNPECRTYGNEYDLIEWFDSRPKPVEIELQAITQQDLDATDKEFKINLEWQDRFTKFLFLVNWDMENRMRVREGKPELTQQQYFDALRNKARNLDTLLEV